MRWICFAAIALTCIVAGCSSPNRQLTLIQEDKQQLLATIKNQRETIRTLQAQDASKEARLAEAEKELARLPGATRTATRPADSPPVKTEPLPWRAPAKGPTPPAKMSSAPQPSQSALAGRENRVQIDPQTKTARLNADVSFADGQAVITADGKRQLDEVARLLKSDDFRDLRVMIAGYAEGRPAAGNAPTAEGEKYTTARQLAAARAQAVADYLDRHGIAQERLGVSGLGSRGPLGGAGADRLAASGSVQIYLLEQGATVVGWGPTGEPIRR